MIDRRQFIKNSLVISLSAFSQIARSDASVLRYLCWDGYDLRSVSEKFEQLHHCLIQNKVINDSPAAFVELMKGGHQAYDLVSIDSPWLDQLDELGVLSALPPSLQKTLNSHYYAHIRDYLFSQQDTPHNWAATRWGWVAPAINLDYVKESVFTSYAPCFDKKYRGKIGVMDWGDWPMLPLALYAGINPYNVLDEYELKELGRVFRALFNNQPAFVADVSLGQKALVDGSLITLLGTGTYLTSALRRAGFLNIKTITPEPRAGLAQSIVWMEGSGVIKGQPRQALALDLIEYMNTTEASYLLSYTGITCNLSTNNSVEALYTAQQKESLQVSDIDQVWENSIVHKKVPSIAQMLDVWQSELFASS